MTERHWSRFTNRFTLELAAHLRREFGSADVFVWGDQTHPPCVRVRVVSDLFGDKTRTQRQEMVAKIANGPTLEPVNDIPLMLWAHLPGEESDFERVCFEEPWNDPIERTFELSRAKR